ncbi:MAG: HAD family phosphatase, partial [Proteobacteria bacterium]
VLGAEDYPQSKPAPDGYLKALSLMKATAEETLVFEDSEAGISSGLSAGLWVAAVTSTNHLKVDQTRAHVLMTDWQGVDSSWVERLELVHK